LRMKTGRLLILTFLRDTLICWRRNSFEI
jgi:hypothetical protein